MMIIAAVMTMFANTAQASVGTSGYTGKDSVLSNDGVEAIKGILAQATKDSDPEAQQAAVDALNWLQEAHKAGEVVDLAKSSGQSADIVKAMYEVIQSSSPEEMNALADLGKKVYVQVNTARQQVTVDGETTMRSIRWASLQGM